MGTILRGWLIFDIEKCKQSLFESLNKPGLSSVQSIYQLFVSCRSFIIKTSVDRSNAKGRHNQDSKVYFLVVPNFSGSYIAANPIL